MHNVLKTFSKFLPKLLTKKETTVSEWRIITSTFQSAKYSGPPRTFNTQVCRQIIKKLQIYPKITSIQIAAEIKEAFGKDVHSITVKRVLDKVDYYSRVAFLISKLKETFKIWHGRSIYVKSNNSVNKRNFLMKIVLFW